MRFLDTSHATKQGDVKESLETILASLREVAAQRETEAGGERISELKQLLEHVGETIREEGSRVKGLEEKQNVLVKEVEGLGNDVKKNFEKMERFWQEESESRRKWEQQYELSAQNRRGGGSRVLRRPSRPLLIQTGAGSEQGAVSGRIDGNLPLEPQQQGLLSANLPRPGVFANAYNPAVVPSTRGGQTYGTSAPSKVARFFPRRPASTVLSGFPATAANVSHLQPRVNHGVWHQQAQCVKRKPFDVFALDSDSESD